MIRFAVSPFLACALLCAAGACESPTEPTVITLQVAPTRVDCFGLFATKCLQVRTASDGEWEAFYGDIRGFDWEEGYLWTLSVLRRRVREVPADGSSHTWTLIRIIDRQPQEETG